MNPVTTTRGSSPIVLAMPHTGTYVPTEIAEKLNERGKALADTDWHIDRLYRDILPDASRVQANFHRYVIDANRDPNGESLYPGQNTTGLCPLTDFDGERLYAADQEPDAAEIESRHSLFHQPYHAALQAELQRLKHIHGFVVLYDCHSIRSRIPYLFEGQLPDFNIGTFDGKSCAAALSDAVHAVCAASEPYQSVVNARFKGGWTTRHYGQPSHGVHAIQMELAQRNYMQEQAPWQYKAESAVALHLVLEQALNALAAACATFNLPANPASEV